MLVGSSVGRIVGSVGGLHGGEPSRWGCPWAAWWAAGPSVGEACWVGCGVGCEVGCWRVGCRSRLGRRRRRRLAGRALGGLGHCGRGAATATAATATATTAATAAAARRDGAATAGAVGDGGVVAGDVGVVERQHQVDVLLAVVVAEDRRAPAGVGGEVVVAGAEVDRGRERGVVDVLGVALAVAVGVDADDRPGRGDELHRADGAVEAVVTVEQAGVGVVDAGGAAAAVERDAVDGRAGQAVAVEVAAVDAAVVGLDPPDRRDQLPGQVAGGVGGVDDDLGALVGRQGGARDAVDGGVADGVVEIATDAGRELGAGRQAGRRLDRLVGDGAAVGQRAVGRRAGRAARRSRRRRCSRSRRPTAGRGGPGWRPSAEGPAGPCQSMSGRSCPSRSPFALAGASLTRWHLPNEGSYPRVTFSNHDTCGLASAWADVESSRSLGTMSR